MIRNYLKVAFRSIFKNKIFSLINITGLAIGIAASLLIFQYVNFELSYDNYHENADRSYRIKTNRFTKGELTTEWAAGAAGVGYAMKEAYPEVEELVRMRGAGGVFSFGDVEFSEERAYLATENVFKMFETKFIHGDAETALVDGLSIVVSESIAKKYFGRTDVIGEVLEYNREQQAKINGVFEDLPPNTHFKYDILVSWNTFSTEQQGQFNTAWNWDGFYNYLLLTKGTDKAEFETKMATYFEENQGDEFRDNGFWMSFELQPIQDIHLYSNFMIEMEVNGDGDTVYALLIISFFIIIIAWVNYINLATAKSMERAREVGLRKVLGSLRGQLIRQFLTESFLINIFAVALGFVLVILAMPYFSELSGQEMTFALFAKQGFWIGLGGLFLIGTFLSGLYPAFVLSGFRPIQTLKGNMAGTAGGSMLRKSLVVFQFMASVGLMIGTYAVYQQVSFMRNQDLGVDINKMLVLNGPGVTDSTYRDKMDAFVNLLEADANVEKVVISSSIPGNKVGWNAGGIRKEGAPLSESNQYRVISVGHDFMQTYDMELLAGRLFSRDFGAEEENVVFSRAAAKLFGFANPEEAIGTRINFWGNVYTIVGVTEDYHQNSLREDYDQLIFRFIPTNSGFYSIKYNGSNTKEVVKLAEEKWGQFFAGNPFEYFFLDDHYNEQYKADQQFGTVFTVFSVLAIFVACLGLFGLAAFMAAKRTKEIGIRKVLGASVPGILKLLSTDFLKLIIVAVLLAIPLAYYGMNQWLNTFAFRIDLYWYIFAIPAVAVFAIALATVSFQTSRAARANPVESLRYE